MKSKNWLIPFKGYNSSGAYNLNFLYQEDNVYIMDNHRAALWCWFQHIDIKKQYSLFHIDRHKDALQSRIEEWKQVLPRNLHEKSLDEYLSYEIQGVGCIVPVIRWDNYLSLMLELYPATINNLQMATHDEGDSPNYQGNIPLIDIWDIPENYDYWTKEGGLIVNIDLDYFFCDLNGSQIKMVSNQYLEILFCKISKQLKDKTIKVLTISLSPDFSGGWDESIALCNKVSEYLDLSFSIPLQAL
jgi:hypothetical protein